MNKSTRTRKLIVHDNLEAMSKLESESVGIIYMDPPFNSGRDFDATLTVTSSDTISAVQHSFSDKWTWELNENELINIFHSLPVPIAASLRGIINTFPHSDIAAYCLMMTPRLYQAQRLLSETGSLYLHCDPSASHYLKFLLDAIFGRENFRNEIIWKRTYSHNSSNRYGPVHDVILFYSKSQRFTWNSPKTGYTKEYVENFYTHNDEKGLYQLITCNAPGDRTGTRAHYEWRGIWPPPGRHWAWMEEQMAKFEEEGRLVYSSNGIPRLKRYLHEGSGVALKDLWMDIDRLDAHSEERIGFETQKPVELLERIIQASSCPGDLILDPFSGSGTTLVAAERQDRQWIGIDISVFASGIALGRVRQEVGLKAIEIKGFPTTEANALKLRGADPLAYGVWGASMLLTVPINRDLERGIVSGRAKMKHGSRQTNLASWVPIRRNYEPKLNDMIKTSAGALGVVLKADDDTHQLIDWIKNQTHLTSIREVMLADLVDPDAVSKGFVVVEK